MSAVPKIIIIALSVWVLLYFFVYIIFSSSDATPSTPGEKGAVTITRGLGGLDAALGQDTGVAVTSNAKHGAALHFTANPFVSEACLARNYSSTVSSKAASKSVTVAVIIPIRNEDSAVVMRTVCGNTYFNILIQACSYLPCICSVDFLNY